MRDSLVRLSVVALLILSGCSEDNVQKLQGYAQGTTYHISYWSEQAFNPRDIKISVETEFATIDKLLSNYRPDSTIETFNSSENTESFNVGAEIVSLVKIAQDVYQASAGCYDLTIKPLFDLWGFQGEKPGIPNAVAIQQALTRVGMTKLRVIDDKQIKKNQANLKVDLSSIAQGYSVEKISQVLEKQGVTNYLVEIGGELKTRGQKPDKQPWRIAIERPLPGEQTLHKVVDMPMDLAYAVMTSGTYRHYFDENGKRYSHILDARTGWPVNHDLVSVTVINASPIIADAWSTALLCLGQENGLKVANENAIAALFIQQHDKELVETNSNALNQLKTIVLH